MSTFGESLKRIRLAKGMSQDDMANLFDTSKQVISRYENGIREPKLAVAVKYAEKLGISLVALIDNAKRIPVDEIEPVNECIKMFKSLPPDLQEEAMEYMRYLIYKANRKVCLNPSIT